MTHENVGYYTAQLQSYSGELVEKFKQCIEYHSDNWLLQYESLLIDVLDDRTMTADDVVEALQSIYELEDESCKCFKSAITAMALMLKRSKQQAEVSVVIKKGQPVAEEGLLSGILPKKPDTGLSQGLTSLI